MLELTCGHQPLPSIVAALKYCVLRLCDEHVDDVMLTHTQPATYILIGTGNFVIVTIMWDSLRLTPNTH